MMIAIPEPEWDVFYAMSTADLAAILVELAQGVRLQAFRKSPRRPKKPHPQGKKPARKGHVSTAKLPAIPAHSHGISVSHFSPMVCEGMEQKLCRIALNRRGPMG